MNEDPPVIWRSGRTSIPGLRMSTRKAEIPARGGAAGSVRHSSRPTSAMCASDVHTFWPLTTQSSPSGTARVDSPARSDPAPGSLKSSQATRSPRKRAGTTRVTSSGAA